MGADRLSGDLGISRTALLLHLAGCEDQVQADRPRVRLGSYPATLHDAHLLVDLRGVREAPVRRDPVPALQLCGAAAMDALRRRDDQVDEQHGRECAHYDQGLLPAAADADLRDHVPAGGLLHRVLDPDRDDVLLRVRADGERGLPAALSAARHRDLARSRPLAVGAERAVP